jgi:membrane fusion protein, multidrug efflux system
MDQQTDTAVQEKPKQPSQEHAPLPASDQDLRWKTRSRDPRFRIAVIAGLIVLALVGFFLWRHFSSYEGTDDAQIDGHLNSVSPRVSGHVIKILVQDNQFVQAGTPLVEIDPSDYQVALESAQAAYSDASAQAQAAQVNVPITSVGTSSQVIDAEGNVQNAVAGVAMSQRQLEASQALLAETEANNAKAQNDLARYKQLVDKQEVSQQQYDQAVAAAKAGDSTVAAQKAQVAQMEQGVVQSKAKLSQAQASLRNANTAPQQLAVTRSRAQSAQAQANQKKAELDQAQLNLQYTKIVAPVSGIVSNRTVEVGQNVAPGQELMKIINLDDIWVTANFKENQLREMRVGQPVTISVDAYGKKYKGKVESVAGASGSLMSLLPPENATGNYVKVVQRIPVKIVFDAGETKEHLLRPGMSVEPKVWIK